MNPKPELLIIRQHRLLQWGSSDLPTEPTSTTHTPPTRPSHPGTSCLRRPGSTPRPRPISPHAAERQPPLPARGPAPRQSGERAPPSLARARRVTAPPFPHPARTALLRGAARAPLAGPAGALPAPRPARPPPAAAPCPLAGSPALGWTASADRTRLRFRLRLVQTA